MEVHKPKPVHSWREFLTEIGTIVLGVLIALGAEQAVETLHWRHEVETERAALSQEAADSFDGVAQRQRQQACVDRRLDEIRTLLERRHRGEPVKFVHQVGYPVVRGASRGSWQIALAGQALSHMDHGEKLNFSDIFSILDLWDGARADERQTWYRLAMLNTPDLLTETDWGAAAAAYNQAIMINDRVRAVASFILAKKLPGGGSYHVAPTDVSGFKQIEEEICEPLLAGAA